MASGNYVIQVLDSILGVTPGEWNSLLQRQHHPTPFMRHEYLAGLERSGSASADSGWIPRIHVVRNAGGDLLAACPLYLKTHSRGEYVFDWSWADAHHRHGFPYYPKAVVAVPFTPVPGSRLLAVSPAARDALMAAALETCESEGLSSLHVLFADAVDMAACSHAGLMSRHTIQFHWQNRASTPYLDFDDFLKDLSQEKRKKIRQERRKVREAGVSLRPIPGPDMRPEDWDFFYACYERTYAEHGNPPYLRRAFFDAIAREQAHHWLIFVAEREGRRMASSLIAISEEAGQRIAWGRYWGAIERVDCLHFEACYYAPLQWCIEHGYDRFEGGAQGEHKLARALQPVRTDSAHWIAQPQLAAAIRNFLQREGHAVQEYHAELQQHTPFRLNAGHPSDPDTH